MKVLITGASGFIGSRLALHARAAGHDVVGTGRAEGSPEAEVQNIAELAEAGIVVRGVDMLDEEALAAALEGCDTVFHLAAKQHEMNVPDQVFRDVNVDGTRRLLELSEKAGVRRFVYGSTIGVHGEGSSGVIDENTPIDPQNIYDVTKTEAEELARSFAGRVGVSCVRIGEAYGPGDRRLLKLYRGIQRGRFFLIGPSRNLHQPIYVDDLVEGLWMAATREEAVGQTMLMAGPNALTTRAMAEIIGGVVGKPLLRVRAPLSLFLATAFCMEKTLRPLGIQPPLHRRRMNFFTLNWEFSMEHPKQLMGFEPRIQFDEGAARTGEWYRQRGLLD